MCDPVKIYEAEKPVAPSFGKRLSQKQREAAKNKRGLPASRASKREAIKLSLLMLDDVPGAPMIPGSTTRGRRGLPDDETEDDETSSQRERELHANIGHDHGHDHDHDDHDYDPDFKADRDEYDSDLEG